MIEAGRGFAGDFPTVGLRVVGHKGPPKRHVTITNKPPFETSTVSGLVRGSAHIPRKSQTTGIHSSRFMVYRVPRRDLVF